MNLVQFASKVQKNINGGNKVKVTRDEVSSEARTWEQALVGVVSEKSPPLSSMKDFISCNWKKYAADVELHPVDLGIFVFRFKNAESMQLILNHGPWVFEAEYLILRPWSPEMSLEKKLCKWIWLPYLKLHLWSPQTLCKIASMVGTPLCTDKPTAAREKLSYARIYVELDYPNTCRVPDSVVIEDEKTGLTYRHMVEYESLPNYITRVT